MLKPTACAIRVCSFNVAGQLAGETRYNYWTAEITSAYVQVVEVARFFGCWFCLTICYYAVAVSAAEPSVVDYDRDVRPILSSHCFQCHGPDQKSREADLRLDTRTGLFGATKANKQIVSPKDTDHSELYRRVSAADEGERMPPTDGGKPLSPGQIDLLRRWIEQGAVWRGQWAYEPIVRPHVPAASDGSADHPIDAFLQGRWKTGGVTAVAVADANTLWRRLNLDLTGLVPVESTNVNGSAEVNPVVYAEWVERLLASPAFGERMAVYWLDLVRYADSCGYHSDVDQQVSPYRDYVIAAFNQNKPFDQFTLEQLAGDLLPEPTIEQRIATGFNRLNKSTEEGGAQEEEYLAKAFADRVRTVSGTWLAATLGCAECHDHKFDPLTTRDFYSLGAFFADVKEKGVYNGKEVHGPELLLPTVEQQRQLEQIDSELKSFNSQRQGDGCVDERAMRLREDQINDRKQRRKDLESRIARTLVTVSVSPREIRVLPRGDWLSKTGDIVQPAFPEALPHPSATSDRLTRRDLADWLVRRDNPLPARVFVNRVWKMFFGTGLSKSLDDFGVQGEPPMHPELLDWLSVEFIESGWDVKHLIRNIVTSRAYRLSSVPTPDLVRLDPGNRLYARQSRWRVEAEFLRDNALRVSGLLVQRIGGPSVKPYQPEGYWEFLNFPKRSWKESQGADLYRRGLYTHWQRTFLHPALLAFDAPSREECTASRAISNTPKSALALLNDPEFVEAARKFAERVLHEGGSTDPARLAWAINTALNRPPESGEIELLTRLLNANRQRYQSEQDAADKTQTVGHSPAAPQENKVEAAAWTAVARAILNLHEFTTRN